VRRDLLDLDRWRKTVEGQVARIDEAHAVQRDEPQLSIGSRCDVRGVGGESAKVPDAIRVVEDRGTNRRRRIAVLVDSDGPGVEIGSGNASDAAGHVQPERIVALHHRIDIVARQSVFARQGSDVAVLDPAEPALSGGPKRTVLPDPKVVYAPRAQA